MATAALTAFKIIGPVAAGLQGRAQGMNQAAAAQSEALMAETQALQRDTLAREELQRYLGSVRAVRGANGLSANSPNAMLLASTAIAESDKGRLRARADDRQRAANFRTSAQYYRRAGNMSLATGVLSAGVPLAEYGINEGWSF